MVSIVGGMNTKIGLGHVKNQPALAYVIMCKTEFVPNKRAHFLRIRHIEFAMHSFDHSLINLYD